MRMIVLFGALALLTSCGPAPKPPATSKAVEQGLENPNDPSPIKISDGSVRLNERDHFKVDANEDISVNDANHRPTYLGFMCTPGDDGGLGDCSDPCKTPSPTSACHVPLTGLASWQLAVYDAGKNIVANLGWDSATKDKITLKFPFGYLVQLAKPPATGVDLVASSTHIGSATLSAGSMSCTFTCPTMTAGQPTMCLTIGNTVK